MGIANQQNMTRTIPVLPQPYGIRVRLRRGDPFAKLVGADWQKTHWFFTAAERDRVPQELRVWLRYRSEKYFGAHRTPPGGRARR
jgi:hypothetical protein